MQDGSVTLYKVVLIWHVIVFHFSFSSSPLEQVGTFFGSSFTRTGATEDASMGTTNSSTNGAGYAIVEQATG